MRSPCGPNEDYVPALRSFLPQPRAAPANPMSAALFVPLVLAASARPRRMPSPASERRRPRHARDPRYRAAVDVFPVSAVDGRPTAIAVAGAARGACSSGWSCAGFGAGPRRRRRRHARSPCASWRSCARSVSEIEPYAFSVAVSDVLRTFISNAKFRPAGDAADLAGIPRRDFRLAHCSAKRTARCSADFLEKCDMIKFARMEATSDGQRGAGGERAGLRAGRAGMNLLWA